MKKVNLLSILILLLFSLISCDESAVNEPPKKSNNNEIVPLSIGNNWVYLNYDYEIKPTPTIVYSDEKITKDTIINNVKYFVLEKLFSPGKSFCYSDSSGYFQSSKDYNVKIKYPVQVGEVFYMSPYHDTVKVISVNQKITVPAGTFECIHYQSFDTIPKREDNGVIREKYLAKVDFYYSVGVGMVLTNYSTSENNRSIVMIKKELMEYTVKN
jgi:hypothetical protein